MSSKPSADDIKVEVSDTPADAATGEPPAPERAKSAAVIDRNGNRAWTGEGKDASEATTRAVRSFVGSRHAGEYISR